MIEIPGVLAGLATLFVIAAALGAAAVVARASYLRNTIADQKASIEALEKRESITRQDLNLAQLRIQTLEAEVQLLKSTRDALAASVTGHDKLAELAASIDERHALLLDAMEERHTQVMETLAGMAK